MASVVSRAPIWPRRPGWVPPRVWRAPTCPWRPHGLLCHRLVRVRVSGARRRAAGQPRVAVLRMGTRPRVLRTRLAIRTNLPPAATCVAYSGGHKSPRQVLLCKTKKNNTISRKFRQNLPCTGEVSKTWKKKPARWPAAHIYATYKFVNIITLINTQIGT